MTNTDQIASGRLNVLHFTYSDPKIEAYQRLAPDWQFETLSRDESLAERAGKLARADVIIHAEVKLTADDIAAASRLQMVQRTGAGLDGLDLEALRARGIPVDVSAGGTAAVAEHTIMLMLAVGLRLGNIHLQTVGGGWPKWQFRSEAFGLKDRTVGIVGFGRIGQAVAERVLAFGASVVVRRDDDRPLEESWLERGVKSIESYDDLFARSDYVTLHCPLTDQTRGLVGGRLLKAMRPHAILINTSRGAVVDEAALADAVHGGHIGGAGLDVLVSEPPKSPHPLIGVPNVIVTPHLASGTRDSNSSKLREIVSKIADATGSALP